MTKKKNKEKKESSVLKQFIILAVLVISIISVRIYVVDYFNIAGSSMQPTLENKDKVIVFKQFKKLKRGDVITFKASDNDLTEGADPKNVYVKRIIGLPGDTVSKDADGNIFVNDKEVNQYYLTNNESDDIESSFEKKYGSTINGLETWDLNTLSQNPNWNKFSKNTNVVPDGTYFVLGDHRSVSSDSRYFGYVKDDSIIGRVSAFPFINKDKSMAINNEESFFKN